MEYDDKFAERRINKIQEQKVREDNDPTGGSGRLQLYNENYPRFKAHTEGDGKNATRLMESNYTKDETEEYVFPWYECWMHYDETSRTYYFCPRRMLNKPCPSCEGADRLVAQKAPYEVFNGHRPKAKSITWLIDRADESKGPMLWAMPGHHKLWSKNTTFAYDVYTECWSKKGGFIYIQDPKRGRDITFKAIADSHGTKYLTVRRDEEESPLSLYEDKMTEWIKFVNEHPIKNIVKFYEYNAIVTALSGNMPATVSSNHIVSEATRKQEETKPAALHVTRSDEAKPAENKPTVISEASTSKLTVAMLEKMNRDMLVKVIESNDLTIKPEDWLDDADLRQVIVLDMGLN